MFSKCLVAMFLVSFFGTAQVAPVADQPDPEDRNHGVARISLINGDVSVRRGDSADFIAAVINAPLLVQDAIQTGPGARAEVQFDYANRLRLSQNAEVRMAELVADRFQVQIGRGTTSLSILRDGAAQVAQIEIDTPSVAVRPFGPGNYRIAVLEDGSTQITVRAGEARINSSRGEERLLAGQTMLARGSADNPEFQIVAAIGRDEWDAFNEHRDRAMDHSESNRYVSRDIVGAEDLDAYGQWETDPTYGQVWAPRVAADWAPYRSGRWVWEDYYGWTWVSYDPWGWAPYHYGNWFVGSRGWCWYPGARYGRHFYRPALVGFFGFGVGAGFGFGFGNIGWVPLAPFERFHPWYGRGFAGGYRGFGGGVNVAENYRNARFANGATSMNARDFSNGNFGRFSNVGASDLRQANLVHGALPLASSNGTLRFNDRQTAVTGRNSFSQTRFASHNQPTQSTRMPFQQQQQSASGAAGWQRFGSPNRQFDSSFGRPSSQPQSSSTWQRFGAPNPSVAPSYRAPQAPAPQTFRQDYGSRAVQVAPPMVRERAAPVPAYRSNSGSYSRPQPSNSGGSYRSAPAPAQHSSSHPATSSTQGTSHRR